jgi:protease secretion system outer membrane protein
MPRIFAYGNNSAGMVARMLAGLAAALLPHMASALDLLEAYNLARNYDPQFQGARAEREANDYSSSAARTAYLPQANYSRSQIQTVPGTVQNFTLSQPVFSLDRYATFRQGRPRAEFASATWHSREQELATRVLRSVTDMIRAREAVVLNQAKIVNLERQHARARRLYELGQGTLTDLRDIQVKYEQSKSNQITLQVNQRAAELVFRALTGVEPGERDFKLPPEFRPASLAQLDEFKSRMEQDNPGLNASRQTERIEALEAQRVKGTLFPTVALAYSRSQYSGAINHSTGVTLQLPLNAGTYYSSGTAGANAAKAREDRRLAEERARVELERLYGLVRSGQDAIRIKRQAIDSAELSVEGNQKSYDAGVRSNIDVMNSIQVLYEVKNDYVVAVTQQAENQLSLMLLAGLPLESSFHEISGSAFPDH